MHAAYRWTTWMLVGVAGLTLGCRGPNPFNRFVQITPQEDVEVPPIEAPPQRLATAQPRQSISGRSLAPPSANRTAAKPTQTAQTKPAKTDPSPAAAKTTVAKATSDDSPHVTTMAAHSEPNEAIAATASAEATEQTEISKGEAEPESKVATQTPTPSGSDSTEPSAKEPTQSAADAEAVAQSKSSQPDSEAVKLPANLPAGSKALLEAFANYPPEIQREALRRLVAVSSISADQTLQPNAIELEGAINNLPQLPDAGGSNPAGTPKRIADAAENVNADVAVATLSDQQDDDSNRSKQDSATVSDLVETEVETGLVQTVSDSSDGDAIQPVSAAKESNEGPMVAQALDASSRLTPGLTADPEVLSNKLSTDVLYAALLKQLTEPGENETEAERNSRLIRMRHLMVLAGNPDDAVRSVDGMANAEQEFLRHQLLGLWTMIDPQGHPVTSRRFSSAIPQIREAAKFAAAATDSLEVRSIAFCTEIESYGQIKPFEKNEFQPGQQVILYCEIENFTVNKIAEGYETHLQGSYDIYDASGTKVVSQLLPADRQVSANFLRDYFIAYQMHLPQQLEAGAYRLQLTMEDVSGKKYGQTSLEFQVK